ncbi:MAG TPA: hypothetical protein VF298_06225, partial [Bacteroidales bacterium]
MKKLPILFGLLVCITSAFSQSDSIDVKLRKIAVEKDDNIRIDLINDLYSISESNPELDMQNAQKLLLQSQKNKDQIAEAMAMAEIGYGY